MATTLAELIAGKRELIDMALEGFTKDDPFDEKEAVTPIDGAGAKEIILAAYDEIAWNLREMAHASKAYEKVLTAYGYETKDYIRDFIYFKVQEEISDAGLTNEDFEKIAEEGIKALKKAKE